MKHFWTPFLLGSLACLGLWGCEDSPVVCTQEIAPSVRAFTVDGEGNPVEPDLIFFRLDGGPEIEVEECSIRDGQGQCRGFDIGWEQPGTFEITAFLGEASDTQRVTVRQGVCHVKTREITLVLTP